MADVAQQAADPSTGEPVSKVIREQNPTAGTRSPEQREKVREFLSLAFKRFKIASISEELQRKRSIEEVEFDGGQHWDAAIQIERENKDQVVLQVNRTPQYLQQVANQQRMTRPVIKIIPEGRGADEETAKIDQGIIRHIEKRSKSSDIRDDAFYRMLQKGWAYWGVNVEWAGPKSWMRTLKTRRIYDDFSVYCDPSCLEPDRTDSNFYFIIDDIPIDEFKKDNPDTELISLTEFMSTGDAPKEWMSDKTIRVAEYWYRERDLEKLYVMADDPLGDGFFEDELAKDEDTKELLGTLKDENGHAMYRMSYRDRIMYCKFNAVEIYDGNEDLTAGREVVPGLTKIPIVFTYGRRIRVEGKYIWTGMVRDGMEPCLAMDYWLSAITEMVALGPKAPWVVAFESIAQYRTMWDSANLENYAALYYDKTNENGDEYPAPFRNFGEPPIQGMQFILNFAEEDLKRVMGIYNRSLGGPGPEHSGTAIRAVQQQGDVANFHYVDNQGRAITNEGDIYLDMMKNVYTAPQVINIIRPDGELDTAHINQEFRDPKTGKPKKHVISDGDYACEVEIGPSARTRMLEAFDGMTQYLQTDPGAAPFIGDLLIEASDYPEKDRIAKRLKARVPPQALAQDDTDGKPVTPPEVTAQMTQLQQQLQEATQQLQAASQALKDKQAQYNHEERLKALELASQERQTKMRCDAQIETSKTASTTSTEVANRDFLTSVARSEDFDFVYTPGVGLKAVKRPPDMTNDNSVRPQVPEDLSAQSGGARTMPPANPT